MCDWPPGLDGMLAHNAWPTLWAKVNADAVAKSRQDRRHALFHARGIQRRAGVLSACCGPGDQAVDFSRHDGLQTVICAALSSGLLGNAYHHSDIGGYTSIFGNVRTPELLQRWAEMAAFTAVMRTHEGNRPAENLQIDQDPQVLAHFARMTRRLSPPGAVSRALERRGGQPRDCPCSGRCFCTSRTIREAYESSDFLSVRTGFAGRAGDRRRCHALAHLPARGRPPGSMCGAERNTGAGGRSKSRRRSASRRFSIARTAGTVPFSDGIEDRRKAKHVRSIPAACCLHC